MQTGENTLRSSQPVISIARRKARVYRALYALNFSFALIVEHWAALGEGGALPRKLVHRYQSFAQELQAQINDDVTEILQSFEGDDLYRFGKVRQAYEKEVRDPDDVFIEAEQRRKELAKQARNFTALKSPKKTTIERVRTSRPKRKE